jgi:hypothetical protein
MDINQKWALIWQSKKKERAEGQEAKAVFWVAKLREDPSLVSLLHILNDSHFFCSHV